MTLTDYELEHIIEFYHKPEYRQMTDYEKVMDLAFEVTDGDNTYTAYPCPGQTIYLDEDGYAVTYRRQKVDIENNKYFYNFTDTDDTEDDMLYEYVNKYEWKKTETPIGEYV